MGIERKKDSFSSGVTKMDGGSVTGGQCKVDAGHGRTVSVRVEGC